MAAAAMAGNEAIAAKCAALFRPLNWMVVGEDLMEKEILSDEISIMSESPGKHGISEGMRTFMVGVIGTAATLTLKEWSDLAAALAGFGTFLYMMFKCWDWIREKLVAKRARKRKNRHHSNYTSYD